ncbi:hypothetical protein ACFFUB_07155 [Algimonas porphyrae]|uniref:DUF3619 family protein n=1 Tax=Algimonas porphyrae TaxID=1128113 RepID=A0ABQ5V1V1_9PROT|nr:hypothetical protein [Algimonas porphyrae]GLQ21057.1 hypothetical protein GCM10007854_20120 [Algimonas porphyrae]
MPDPIETAFARSSTPAPRADLADRIMSAARDQAPLDAANDHGFWHGKTLWAGMTGIAATLVAGFFVMNSQPSDAELWASHADQSGFGDLYEWVYAEDSDTTQ